MMFLIGLCFVVMMSWMAISLPSFFVSSLSASFFFGDVDADFNDGDSDGGGGADYALLTA